MVSWNHAGCSVGVKTDGDESFSFGGKNLSSLYKLTDCGLLFFFQSVSLCRVSLSLFVATPLFPLPGMQAGHPSCCCCLLPLFFLRKPSRTWSYSLLSQRTPSLPLPCPRPAAPSPALVLLVHAEFELQRRCATKSSCRVFCHLARVHPPEPGSRAGPLLFGRACARSSASLLHVPLPCWSSNARHGRRLKVCDPHRFSPPRQPQLPRT